jgi:hypothetical protein
MKKVIVGQVKTDVVMLDDVREGMPIFVKKDGRLMV